MTRNETARSVKFTARGSLAMAQGFKRGTTFVLMVLGGGEKAYTITRLGGWRDGFLTFWAKPK